jgi:DNA gyrase subunit A
MMNLDEGVRIARIAKVREKVSDGDQEFDDIAAAERRMEEEKATMPVENDQDFDEDDMIYPKEDTEE